MPRRFKVGVRRSISLRQRAGSEDLRVDRPSLERSCHSLTAVLECIEPY